MLKDVAKGVPLLCSCLLLSEGSDFGLLRIQ